MLFLDEFTEFRRDAIEGMRQPLEPLLAGIVHTGEPLEHPQVLEFLG